MCVQVGELQRSLKSSQSEQQEALERCAAAVSQEQRATQDSITQVHCTLCYTIHYTLYYALYHTILNYTTLNYTILYILHYRDESEYLIIRSRASNSIFNIWTVNIFSQAITLFPW